MHPSYFGSEGTAIPTPSSLAPGHQSRVGSGNQYIVKPLSQETIYYSIGVPLLKHYLMPEVAVVDRGHRYAVPTAAKSIYVRDDKELLARKANLLQVFAECFPADAQRYGQTFDAKSSVYDLFPQLEESVNDALLAVRITYKVDNKDMIGYFIDPKAYQSLYDRLRSIRGKWLKVILDITGQTLWIPQWARGDLPGEVWTAGEFEMFAIKYREELETFLYLIYKHQHTLPLSSDPEHTIISRPVTQDQSNSYHASQDTVVRPGGIATQHQGYNRFENTSGIVLSSVHVTQSSATQHGRPSLDNAVSLSKRGYANKPAGLSSSRRLSELVGDIPIEHRALTPIRGTGTNTTQQVSQQSQYRHSTPVADQLHHPLPRYSSIFMHEQVPERDFLTTPRNRRQSSHAPPYQTLPSIAEQSWVRQNDSSSHNPREPPPGGHEDILGRGPAGGDTPGRGDPGDKDNKYDGGDNSVSDSEDLPLIYSRNTARHGIGKGGDPPGNDPPDDPGDFNARSPSPRLPKHSHRASSYRTDYSAVQKLGEFHFDRKLKQNIVPTWDGNDDTLSDWLTTVGDLSDRGHTIYTELGQIVPHRLRGDASAWFWSLDLQTRIAATQSWGTIRHKICEFFMNRMWMDKQKIRANNASYREVGHSEESPVQYVIRKLKLLRLVYEYTDSQLIVEVMSTAPQYWNQIMDPQRCVDFDDFLSGIKYHEEALADMDSESISIDDADLESLVRKLMEEYGLESEPEDDMNP